tara:strand:- start:63 stop:464 length:402 start_codon:yes stop_codon:yes gene_type:complete
MNEKISWDQYLVKKYNCSNHFKLLSQLRNEIIKYPLNKKKNISSNIINEIKSESKNTDITTHSHNMSLSINSKKDINTEKSTVSFNNSKNFSIYSNNDNKKEQQENTPLEFNHSKEDSSSSTFKDRLNQIDLK